MSLYVRKTIAKIYDYHVELLVVFIRNYNEFVFVNHFDQSLIKKFDRIYDVNVKTIVYEIDNVCLKRYKIIIRLDNFIEISNVYYDFVFF